MKKRYIFILSLILVILSMSCVSAGLFDGLFGGDDNKNITLINTTTDGWCNSYDDGTSSSVYEIEGILNNLPDNVNKYDLKVSIYDENGKLIKEDNGYNLKSIARSSEKSKPSLIGMVIIDDFKNVSNIEVKLIDEDGTIVFNENTTFNMENMKIYELTKDTSSSDDDSDGDDDSVQPLFKTHTPEEQRELDRLYDKYLADNA